MRRRDWWLAGLTSGSLALVLAGLVAALVVAAAPPTFEGPPRFVLTFADVPDELAGESRSVRADGQVREAVDDLNERVRIDQHVEVRVRSCGYGSSYDLDAQRIDLCLEDAVEGLVDLEDVGEQDPEGVMLDVWRETAMHEAAHALVDVMDVRFTGSEEDAADEFAAWMLLQDADDEGRDAIAAAARHYKALSELYEADTSEGHSPDVERATDYACWVHGSDPAGPRVEEVRLAPTTLAACPARWEELRTRWSGRLEEAGALR